jgi:hypothetical protein
MTVGYSEIYFDLRRRKVQSSILHEKEVRDLYRSPNVVCIVKWQRLRWAGHVAYMGENRKWIQCFGCWCNDRLEDREGNERIILRQMLGNYPRLWGWEVRGCIQKFPDWVINNNNNKHSLRSNTRVMATKLTRLTHKIALQLHLLAGAVPITVLSPGGQSGNFWIHPSTWNWLAIVSSGGLWYW